MYKKRERRIEREKKNCTKRGKSIKEKEIEIRQRERGEERLKVREIDRKRKEFCYKKGISMKKKEMES